MNIRINSTIIIISFGLCAVSAASRAESIVGRSGVWDDFRSVAGSFESSNGLSPPKPIQVVSNGIKGDEMFTLTCAVEKTFFNKNLTRALTLGSTQWVISVNPGENGFPNWYQVWGAGVEELEIGHGAITGIDGDVIRLSPPDRAGVTHTEFFLEGRKSLHLTFFEDGLIENWTGSCKKRQKKLFGSK